MKICYVASDVVVPAPVGGSTHTLEEIKALLRRGHKVYLVSQRARFQKKHLLVDGLTVLRLYRLIFFPLTVSSKKVTFKEAESSSPLRKMYHLYLKTIHSFFTALHVVFIVKKYNVDLIVERSTSLGAGAIAAKITHRPLTVEIITDLYVPLSLKLANKILAYEENVLPHWVDFNKFVKVYAAVNTTLFNPDINAEIIRLKYSLSNKNVIGYAGGFWDFHGIDTLITASKDVIAQYPDTIFLMVGPDYQKYESYARKIGVSKNFIFTGSVPYKEVPNYLAAADILVAPYTLRYKGSPLKIFEYLALRKPVIASNVAAIPDVIIDEQTGLLVTSSDSFALGEKILTLLKNKRLRDQIAERGYESVSKYTWDYLAKMVEQTIEV